MSELYVFEPHSEPVAEDLTSFCARLIASDGLPAQLSFHRMGGSWPMLSLLIGETWCVVHLTTARDGELLTLRAVTETGAPAEHPFDCDGAQTTFTREYLHSRNTAVEVVQAFAEQAPWPADVEWDEL